MRACFGGETESTAQFRFQVGLAGEVQCLPGMSEAATAAAFRAQLDSVMRLLLKAAVGEIAKLVEESFADFQLRLARSAQENESLKLRLRLAQKELRAARQCLSANSRSPGRGQERHTQTTPSAAASGRQDCFGMMGNSSIQQWCNSTPQQRRPGVGQEELPGPDFAFIPDPRAPCADNSSSAPGSISLLQGTPTPSETRTQGRTQRPGTTWPGPQAMEDSRADPHSGQQGACKVERDPFVLETGDTRCTGGEDAAPGPTGGTGGEERGSGPEPSLQVKEERCEQDWTAADQQGALVICVKIGETEVDSRSPFPAGVSDGGGPPEGSRDSMPLPAAVQADGPEPAGQRAAGCFRCGRRVCAGGEGRPCGARRGGGAPFPGPPPPELGPRAFRCPECGRVFPQAGQLRLHQRSHAGERAFPCPQCWKSFRRSDNLRRHLLIHTGEKPYRCTRCARNFRHLHSLKKHKCVAP
ncbi:zinc finger protein 16-like [Lepisosteus oculatus]|uniref:zinc finger protein 16-like n=1 Tax=Lepisosteus oculatus TaxID=7918 RepID=UPI0037210F67